jgi:16S rRNA (guanine966-N2)-methyltransferase
VRIIAGQWRGRKLLPPPGIATRPTADRVRETLFSMLASRIGSFDGLRVADLYAGSGALGLEALSRGADFACFVDQDPAALVAIRANIEKLGAESRSKILPRAVENLPPEPPFDLIFADPPYSPGSGTAALAHILHSNWAARNGWVCIETERGDVIDARDCAVEVERDVGRARLTLLRTWLSRS